MRKIYTSILFLCTLYVFSCNSDEPATTAVRELTIPSTGFESPESYAGMNLVWQDEFNGTSLNADDWNFEIGNGNNGWGNAELQYYKQENSSIVDGNLVIEGRRESFSGSSYTSSRINTQNKRSFKYGRIDVRAVLPYGSGMWPAFWMLGSNYSTVGWPYCGEIDIMEMFGAQGDNLVLGTVHWDASGQYANYGGKKTLSAGSFSEEFHVFSIVWDETQIQWYVDNQRYHVIDITPSDLDEFQKEFFLIINLAIGGDKGAGDPATSIFPQWMVVDYVRVFQPE